MGRAHAERVLQDGRGRIVALFDSDRSSAVRLQQELAGQAAVYDDLDELLDRSSATAAVVCTPTTSHFDQVLACRRRGLHVLCEKPLADSRERIGALIADVAPGGPHAMLAYQRRFWSSYRTLRREVQSGRWGPVRAVTSHNVEHWQPTIAGTWRDDPDINIGGFVGDAGSHKIDAVFCVTGLKPADVFARSWTCGSRVEVVTSVSAVLEGDVPLCMDFIGHAQYLGEDLHIHCAAADLMIRDRRVWIARENAIEPITPLEPESNPISGFFDLLDGKSSNVAPFECARLVFDFTQAVLASSRSGGRVPIPS
jgi:predicted dehydrogenase